ncbi:MAG: hypothetical protein V3U88_10235 [Methylococcales bacterium]
MKSSNKISRAFLVSSLILLACVNSGCDQDRPPMSDGLDDLRNIAQQSFSRLEKGQITRNKGFYIECALDLKRKKGIRISESVCDKNNSRNITIRITDPTSRPPSQQLDKIQLTNQSGDTITAYRGKPATTKNGIKIKFDRSGQSVEIHTQMEKAKP